MAFGTGFLSFISLLLALSASSAAVAVNANAELGKRASLDARQQCDTPGWIPVCPGYFKCIPPGGICCSDGISYAMPPDTCPDGTQPLTTAPSLPPAPTVSSAPPSTISPPPPTTTTINEYVWYTTTLTWTYWYYYYTYLTESFTTTTLTSTGFTTTTAVSVSATDAAEASAFFLAYSATAAFSTPAQTATPLSGFVPPPSTATTTASSVSSSAKATSIVTSGTKTTGSFTTTTGGTVVTAAAARSARPVGGDLLSGLSVLLLGVLGVVPGFLMMVL